MIPLTGVLWSDWGKPERIVETLGKNDKQPAFPLGLLSGPPLVHASKLKCTPICVSDEKKVSV
jgi:hypothetical protein